LTSTLGGLASTLGGLASTLGGLAPTLGRLDLDPSRLDLNPWRLDPDPQRLGLHPPGIERSTDSVQGRHILMWLSAFCFLSPSSHPAPHTCVATKAKGKSASEVKGEASPAGGAVNA
jgi:hypothetical protein